MSLALIPIGRFSKMTRLSVKALRLYDDKGLLQPAHVDADTGYRYYRLEQAQQAEMIRVLRAVSMPLNEIGTILHTHSNSVIAERLEAHKTRLAEQVQNQQRALAYLDSIIQRKEIVMQYEVQISQAPTQLVAAVKIHTSLAAISGNIAQGFQTLMRGLQKAQTTPSGVPMILYHNVIDQDTEGDIEIVVPVAKPITDNEFVHGQELTGGQMVSTIHQGSYESISAAYHALLGWISDNDYEISGPTREIYLNDPQTVAPHELQTKLEFPINAQA